MTLTDEGLDGLFQTTYAQARRQFLDRSRTAAATVYSFVHDHEKGPDGEDLAIDIASFGDPDAGTVVLLSSGTHGIEGFAGSALQALLLDDGLQDRLPANVRLIMLHAVNPFGFAWRRRVNEDNVDLNRNFIDHADHPANPGYAALADAIEPATWTPDSIAQMVGVLQNYEQTHGQAALQSALTGGQYEFENGLFYGGRRPAWSNRRMYEVAEGWLSAADQVFAIDVHTGIGVRGEAECIIESEPGSDAWRQAQAVWGDRVRSTLSGDSVSAAVAGSMVMGVTKAVPGRAVGIGLEFGTVPIQQVMLALTADAWLHSHGDVMSPEGQQIKAQMQAAFFPDARDWRESIAAITRHTTSQLWDYLSP